MVRVVLALRVIVVAEDDTYLDDEDADWKTTTQGQKSVGDTSATLAWRPGDSGQK